MRIKPFGVEIWMNEFETLETTGVMLTPGSAMEMKGSARMGYANAPPVLRAGLVRLSSFLRTS